MNLNRFYDSPDPQLQPTVFAARALAVAAASGALAGGGLKLYLDCHAHSARRGVFVCVSNARGGARARRARPSLPPPPLPPGFSRT